MEPADPTIPQRLTGARDVLNRALTAYQYRIDNHDAELLEYRRMVLALTEAIHQLDLELVTHGEWPGT